MLEHIASISPISTESWEAFRKAFSFHSARAGTQLCEFGQKAKYIYFLQNGLVCASSLTTAGVEYSKSIFKPYTFFGAMTSLFLNKPSAVKLEALCEVEYYQASYLQLMELNKQHHDLSQFYNRQLELLYILKEQKEIEVATKDARQRYLLLRNDIPGIDQFVPQFKIASLLGISPIQLSRIRAKLAGIRN
jgi:CRP-like cAMP-binding protein